MASDEQLYQLWMLYTSKGDVQYFRQYLDRFLSQYSNAVDLDFIHLEEGLQPEGPRMSKLPDTILQAISRQLAACSDKSADNITCDTLQLAQQMIQALIVLCRHHDNLALVASCEYFRLIVPLAGTVLRKIPTTDGEEKSACYSLLTYVLHLCESMYDPYHIWRRQLGKYQVNPAQHKYKPAILSVEVAPFFYDCLQESNWPSLVEVGLHYRVLHMFGAVLTGSQENAQIAISPATVDILFDLLVSESKNNSSNLTKVSSSPSSSRHSVLEVVLKCIVQMVLVTHMCSPEQRQVELAEILRDLFQALVNCNENQEVQLAIFRSIPQMLMRREKLGLQKAFVDADIFGMIITVIEKAIETGHNKQLAGFFCLHIMASVMADCPPAKTAFREAVGYQRLGDLLKALGQPSQELLGSLLDMMVDGTYKRTANQSILNTGPTAILLRLLPLIRNHDLQLTMADNVASSCVCSDYSRMQCCNDGILSMVLDALEARESLHRKTQERLISLMEALGSYSITSSQLKRLIGLMRGTNEDQPLSPHCTRLMHGMSTMARKEGKFGAHHYFHLQEDLSGISIPMIRKWPGHSFTFHTWFCLNSTNISPAIGKFYRRQLYSFYTSAGAGFESFFTFDGVLVVAVCTKKEYYTVPLTDYPITDGQWHCLDIIHLASRRPFGQSHLSVFIDGHQRLSSQLKFPLMNEPFVSCQIGCPTPRPSSSLQMEEAPVNLSSPSRRFPFRLPSSRPTTDSQDSTVGMIQAGLQDMEWGDPRSLQGQLGNVCIFHDALTPAHVKRLYITGCNDLTIFQSEDAELVELGNKLLLHYHGKACRDGICLDLAPSHLYNGRLKGPNCVTYDLKEMMNCIGGVQVLFPLLELVTSDNNNSVPLSENVNDASDPSEMVHPGDVTTTDSPSPVLDGKMEDDWEVLPSSSYSDSKLEQNHVSGFLTLLKNICVGHTINQEVLYKTQGVATIGALLQKVDPKLIDVHVLMAIQLFVESVCIGNTGLLKSAHRYLLFDFRIWSRSEFPVRIGHIQYLSTIIKDDKKTFRKRFGVQYMLDVIRTYYTSNTCDLQEADIKVIRHSLLGLIRYYVYRQMTHKELMSIISFIAAVEEEVLIREAIDTLLALLEGPGKDQLYLLLFENGCADLLYSLLVNKVYSDRLRDSVFKLFAAMLRTDKVYEKSKNRMKLQDVGYSGLTLLMGELPVTMPMAKNLVEQVTECQLNPAGLFAVLQILHKGNALIRLEACTQLLHILYTKKESKVEFAKLPGWQDTLVRLFCVDSDAFSINGSIDTGSRPMTPKSPSSSFVPIAWAEDSQSVDSSKDVISESLSDSQVTPTDDSQAEDSQAEDSQASEKLSQDDISIGYTSRTPTNSAMLFPSFVDVDWPELSEPDSASNSENVSVSSESNFGQLADRQAALAQRAARESPLTNDETKSITSNNLHPAESFDEALNLQSTDSGINLTISSSSRPSDLSLSSEGIRDEESPEGLITSERTLLTMADTLTEILVQIMWRGVQGSDEAAWTARGQVFVCINTLAEKYELIRPAIRIKRVMLEKMLDGAANDIKNASTETVAHSENGLWLMKLVHDFLFGETGHDTDAWSDKLAEGVIDVLDALKVWEDVTAADEWSEMSQLGLRILLGFAAYDDIEVCATAAAKLHHLLQTRPIPSPSEACFLLGSLDSALMRSLDAQEQETYAYLIPLTRAMIEIYHQQLHMTNFLPHLPTTDTSPTFFEDFQSYCRSEEWRTYINKQVQPFMLEFITVNFSEVLAVISKFWKKCFDLMNTDIHRRERARGESKLRFQSKITGPFKQLQKTENTRYNSVMNQLCNQHQSTLRQWRASKRFLTGERGAWSERNSQIIYWKLSSQENFSRMRLKLTQNYNFDPHMDASNERDQTATHKSSSTLSTGPVLQESDTLPLAVAKEARVSDMELMDDRLGDEEWNIDSVENPGEEPGTPSKEKQVISEECQLITLVDVIPGKLEVTTTHVYFYDTTPDKEEGSGQDFKWSLSHLREVHLRRYNLRRSAIEIFFVNQTNYFINFPDKKTRNQTYRRILGLKPPNLYWTGAKSPADLLKASGLTQKWVNREITNFDYLMQLNTIAGRTYNDLSQYPVFPWILTDYNCETLDLEDPNVFRDLTKPIGVINPKNVEEVKTKYESFEDPDGIIDKFHYGTHYSNAAGVMHYLVRMEPFAALHIQLQSGKFDCADRQFHSIPSLWDTLMENPNDVKELIPEFFYLPDFLVNMNEFDLGKLQTGEKVKDVILPKWASSPEDFIYKHRQALECEYVSANLHEWINLIFGYKQKGPDAVEALNVFYYCTYEGAVDLDAIKNPIERQAVEGMINNFGQTPCQLLKEPHPKRLSMEEIQKRTARSQNHLHNLFDHLHELKAFFVEVSTSDNDPLVYVTVPKSQAKSFIYQGMPDTMVTVTEKGCLGVHGWLPYDKSISNYFTFERDTSLLNAKTRKTVNGPFAPGIKITPSLFCTTHDSKLLFSGGHWDNSLRVFNIAKGKMVAHVVRHTDIVTCVALDNCGMQLITGSRDTTCMTWDITYQSGAAGGINSKPLQTLSGHDAEVTCVSINSELDMAVSASKDGTVIIHTLLKGHYVRTLQPPVERPGASLSIPALIISDEGQITIHCRQRLGNKVNQDHRSLHVYSINGKLLCSETAVGNITDMEMSREYLLTGDDKGVLTIRQIFGLKVMSTLPLHLPIHCLTVVPTRSQVLVGLRDGKLIIVNLDRQPEAKKLLGR